MRIQEYQSTGVLQPTPISSSIGTPASDFWFFGGASIIVWSVMVLGQLLRTHVDIVEQSFSQIAATFGILAIICNHPHFMISYRFGYGRGFRFILRHWFSLVFVPLGLTALFSAAYFGFHMQISELPAVAVVNRGFQALGVGFRLGELPDLGTELLSASVWIMYLTVGWHYSKQVFGCMMVYSRYDQYPISRFQRALLKSSVFSIAAFNFLYLMSSHTGTDNLSQISFFNLPLAPLQLPKFFLPLVGLWLALSFSGVLFFLVYKNYRQFKKKPSLNFSIAWIAFHIWWIPIIPQPEYYLLVVPFFHSLQYLPFAYRLESKKITNDKRYHLRLSLGILALLAVGYLAFDLVPGVLDQVFETSWNKTTSFFMIAAIVFINVHHFFIDGVVWKFNQPDIKKYIFNGAS